MIYSQNNDKNVKKNEKKRPRNKINLEKRAHHFQKVLEISESSSFSLKPKYKLKVAFPSKRTPF